jgi:hypothetical protein
MVREEFETMFANETPRSANACNLDMVSRG